MPNWSPAFAAGRAARTPLGVTAIHSEVHAIFDVQHVAMFEVAFGVLREEASEDLVGGHNRRAQADGAAADVGPVGGSSPYLAGCDVRSVHSRRLRRAP
jgi:hypothetical protein